MLLFPTKKDAKEGALCGNCDKNNLPQSYIKAWPFIGIKQNCSRTELYLTAERCKYFLDTTQEGI